MPTGSVPRQLSPLGTLSSLVHGALGFAEELEFCYLLAFANANRTLWLVPKQGDFQSKFSPKLKDVRGKKMNFKSAVTRAPCAGSFPIRMVLSHQDLTLVDPNSYSDSLIAAFPTFSISSACCPPTSHTALPVGNRKPDAFWEPRGGCSRWQRAGDGEEKPFRDILLMIAHPCPKNKLQESSSGAWMCPARSCLPAPSVLLEGNEVVGFPLLLSTRHPKLFPIPPHDVFVPALVRARSQGAAEQKRAFLWGGPPTL
ncbi:hypothetical protein Anapl_02653 [Anas platyrhynchos]|uniref:Uncharacterized protein n=1 Tax=Anas platyrhynchos TaxID=8839 RepID=R0JNH0_ANAPL|nr:hypothetical protein Anapl_02653 [Anas platyrhynchos]